MQSPLNILYVDDNSTTVHDIESTLGTDWDIITATTTSEGSDRISEENIDCIVSTDEFTDCTGVEFYKRNQEAIGETPFLLFSSKDSTEFLQRAYRSGIDDVIVRKDVESDGGVTTVDTPSNSPDTESDREVVNDPVTLLQYRISTLLLDRELDIEEVVLSSIRSLLGAADDELDVKIDFALESLGEAIGATRCVVYNYDADESPPIYRRVNDWCGKDSDCYDSELSEIGSDKILADDYPGHETHTNQFEFVCRDWTPASSTPILTPSVEYTDIEVGTYVSYPLVIGWELQGVIAVTTKYPRTWTERVKRQIKSLGEVIITTKRQRDNRTQLKEQNERLEQFTSVISHDLQNPLNIAKGYVEIALDSDDANSEHLGEASEALERMETMLDELLTLAKQGEAIGETTSTDLGTVVNNAWGNVDTKQAELFIDSVESLSKQQADPSRLQEAFENLFKNAIDHVGEDVEITAKAIDNGIAVGDDGDGISDEEQDQIFDRGYTGGDGTGFGLAIVEEVIDAHGWNITVGESDAGGAEFRIHFDKDG